MNGAISVLKRHGAPKWKCMSGANRGLGGGAVARGAGVAGARPPVRFGTVSGVSRFRNEQCSSGVSRDVTFYPERANSSQTIVRKTPTNSSRAGRPRARPRESDRSALPKMSRRKNRVNDEVCSITRTLRPASRRVDGHIDDRQHASRPEGLKGTGGHDGLSLVHVAPRPGKP